MKRGYNELVGIQATFNQAMPRYKLIHHYRWRTNGKTTSQGTMRGFDMRRHISIDKVLHSLADAYAPAVLSIWLSLTKATLAVLLQLEVGATPQELGIEGEWQLWAEL